MFHNKTKFNKMIYVNILQVPKGDIITFLYYSPCKNFKTTPGFYNYFFLPLKTRVR